MDRTLARELTPDDTSAGMTRNQFLISGLAPTPIRMTNRLEPCEGDILENRFQVGLVLGSGSRAIVYLARHLVTGKYVAIKWPKRHLPFTSVVLEARLAARVRHPCVLDVYDVGQQNGRFFLVMEYIPGLSLAEYLDRGESHFWPFVRIFDALLSGVHALHEQDLVHCDLKPANILLEPDKPGQLVRPKIIDFGSSVVRDGISGQSVAGARIEAQAGSERYMAPEQRKSSGVIDARTDTFALGRILERSLVALPVSASDGKLRAALSRVAAKATDSNANQRFQDVLELQRALRTGDAREALLDHGPAHRLATIRTRTTRAGA